MIMSLYKDTGVFVIILARGSMCPQEEAANNIQLS